MKGHETFLHGGEQRKQVKRINNLYCEVKMSNDSRRKGKERGRD